MIYACGNQKLSSSWLVNSVQQPHHGFSDVVQELPSNYLQYLADPSLMNATVSTLMDSEMSNTLSTATDSIRHQASISSSSTLRLFAMVCPELASRQPTPIFPFYRDDESLQTFQSQLTHFMTVQQEDVECIVTRMSKLVERPIQGDGKLTSSSSFFSLLATSLQRKITQKYNKLVFADEQEVYSYLCVLLPVFTCSSSSTSTNNQKKKKIEGTVSSLTQPTGFGSKQLVQLFAFKIFQLLNLIVSSPLSVWSDVLPEVNKRVSSFALELLCLCKGSTSLSSELSLYSLSSSLITFVLVQWLSRLHQEPETFGSLLINSEQTVDNLRNNYLHDVPSSLFNSVLKPYLVNLVAIVKSNSKTTKVDSLEMTALHVLFENNFQSFLPPCQTTQSRIRSNGFMERVVKMIDCQFDEIKLKDHAKEIMSFAFSSSSPKEKKVLKSIEEKQSQNVLKNWLSNSVNHHNNKRVREE